MRISDWSSDVCSSDLIDRAIAEWVERLRWVRGDRRATQLEAVYDAESVARLALQAIAARQRSEEHTSELQSLMRISYAVFCLKKKKDTKSSVKPPAHN